jgi:hypothetical protein
MQKEKTTMAEPPPPPLPPLTELTAAAAALHELYLTYVEVGFTEGQAFEIVLTVLRGNVGLR